MSIRHDSNKCPMYSDENEETAQLTSQLGFCPIARDTPLLLYLENVAESQATLSTPLLVEEIPHVINNNKVSYNRDNVRLYSLSEPIVKYDVLFGGDSDHLCRYWPLNFGYILIFQLAIVLLVMSFLVFCFLRFKQSSKVRGTIDLELQDLVINHQTFATDDIDPHNTDCEKQKSQTATTSKTDKQIEAKLPDVINSRD